MENGLSASDIALMTDNGFGGSNSFLWIFALLILANGGFGNWGNNRSDIGQYATAASQQEILFGQQFQNLDNKMDRLGNGIADATFALNNSIKDGNYAVSSAVTTEGRGIQTQLADCCCTTQRNIDSVKLDMANYFANTNATIHAEGEATRNMLQQNKIESLQGQISQLQLQNAMCGVVRYPNASTYYAGTNPFGTSCACGCTNL